MLTAPATGFDEGEPYRQWQARDANGALLIEHVGASFLPPAGAAHIRVEVGGQVVVDTALSRP